MVYVCMCGVCMYGHTAVSGRAQRGTRKCALLVRNLHEICSGEPAKPKKKLLTHIKRNSRLPQELWRETHTTVDSSHRDRHSATPRSESEPSFAFLLIPGGAGRGETFLGAAQGCLTIGDTFARDDR